MRILADLAVGFGLITTLALAQSINDFRVNNEDYPADYLQYYASIGCDSAGNAAVVWFDVREIYAQLYAQRMRYDGTPVGSNFRVTDTVRLISVLHPTVSARNDGRFVLVYSTNRNTWCRRFASDGTPLGLGFRVNDDSVNSSNYSAADVEHSDGSFTVVFSNTDNKHVYGQRFDSSGNRLGANFRISDSAGQTAPIPAVRVDRASGSVATWGSGSPGNVMGQRYDSLGRRVGGNFQINDSVSLCGSGNSVSHMMNHGFVVSWRGQGNKIWAQLYDRNGNRIGGRFVVNEDTLSAGIRGPWTCQSGSNAVVSWSHTKGVHRNFVYCQRYDTLGNRIGNNAQVNRDTTLRLRMAARADNAHSGSYYITWDRCDDGRTYRFDIMYQAFSADGIPLGQNQVISFDSGGGNQVLPGVANDRDGNFFITWSDTRNGHHTDVYARRFDRGGSPFSHDFEVNDDTSFTNAHEFSSIAMNSSGLYVMVWCDGRDSARRQICAQRFDRNGVTLGPNYRIGNIPSGRGADYPKLCALPSGCFVLCWSDNRNGDLDVYGQRLDGLGLPVGPEFKVNDDATSRDQDYATVAGDNVGNVVIVWQDLRDSLISIYGQRYDVNGTPAGINFRVNDPGVAGDHNYFPGIAFDTKRNSIIVLSDSIQVRGQRYDSLGDKVGSNFMISTGPAQAKKRYPVLAARNEGEFFVVWSDDRLLGQQRFNLFGQCYRNWLPVGSNYKIDCDTTGADHEYPWIVSDSSRIYIVWTRRRYMVNDYGDIFAKLLEWSQIPMVGEEVTSSLLPDTRFRIWPNPSKTAIRLQILGVTSGDTKIRIYDVAGRMVSDLSESLGAGRVLSVSLNPGVYFVTCSNKTQTITRKAVVVE